MDETKLAQSLGIFTPDQIDAVAEELHAYARRGRIIASAHPGVAIAPFKFSECFKSFVKAVKVEWPAATARAE